MSLLARYAVTLAALLDHVPVPRRKPQPAPAPLITGTIVVNVQADRLNAADLAETVAAAVDALNAAPHRMVRQP